MGFWKFVGNFCVESWWVWSLGVFGFGVKGW